MRESIRVTMAVLLIGALGVPSAAADEPITEQIPSFNESPGCGDLDGIRGPLASKVGLLEMSEPIYGPWADFYGRTIASVHSQLVPFKLPGQSKTLYVHQRAYPALQQVLKNLAAEAAKGHTYTITSNSWSWSRYTIPPTRRLSFHAVGAAIDVNSTTNPYRADNVLITNMPAWFVEAWTSAGWCWGGHWQTIKDPMHYSWKGPIHTPGYVMPPPQPPLVSAANFGSEVVFRVGLSATSGPDQRHFVVDLDRDGAVDVLRIEPTTLGGVQIVNAAARRNFRSPAVFATTPTAPTDPMAELALADLSRDGRPDLVYLLPTPGGVLDLEVFTLVQGGMVGPSTISTAVSAEAGSTYLFDDLNRDGDTDLFIVRPGNPASFEVWLGPGFTAAYLDVALSVGSADHLFALGDRDVDGVPDLFALGTNGTVVVHTGTSGFTASSSISTAIDSTGESLFVEDLDGDGRADLMLVDANGQMRLRRGGNSTHKPGIWFADSTHSVSRLSGSDRYETAAAVSEAHHPNPANVDTVFIATGVHFPDALAGAAIAGTLDAPLLLVTPAAVPAATAAELARLDPDTIVLLGGTGAVSSAVENALGAYGTVVRIAGADRYATAVEVSKFGYPVDGSADTVVIATGESFADALAGGPAAARFGGPVLLTTRNGLPAVTRAEIGRLDPDRIIVLGGTAVISAAVFDELSAIADTERIAGSDRVQTAVAVSAAAFPAGSDRVYVATGVGFPDALAGAAAAASLGSPILLLPESGLPATVVAEILRLGAGEIVILGGTAVITVSVESALAVAGF